MTERGIVVEVAIGSMGLGMVLGALLLYSTPAFDARPRQQSAKICDPADNSNNKIDRIECGFGGPTNQTVREEFILINVELYKRLGDNAQLVNVGEAPNTGTGDPLWEALDKVRYDLSIMDPSHPTASSAPPE